LLTLTGYVLSVIMLVLGLKKPGFAMLGSVLLTILAINEEVVNEKNAVVLIIIWIYSFILLYSKLKL